jgi:hypothetical protein
MVFDTCHSGGMCRVENEDIRPIRCYNELPPMPDDLDSELRCLGHGNRGPSISLGSMYRATESYVLLAACHPRQNAGEVEIGGIWFGAFTQAILNALETWDPSLTYMRLMANLVPLKDQNPHCEGLNRFRRLFSPSQAGIDDPASFTVTAVDQSSQTFEIAAGYMLGVTKGTKFLSQSQDGTEPIVLVADIVEEFRCLAKPFVDDGLATTGGIKFSAPLLPLNARVKMTRQLVTKWLKVELPRSAFPSITEDDKSLFSIVKSGGDVMISCQDSSSKQVLLDRKDALMSSLLELQQISCDFMITSEYLDRIANFNFFLYHQSTGPSRLLDVYGHYTNASPFTASVTASLSRLVRTPLSGIGDLQSPYFQHFIMLPREGENLFHPSDTDKKANAYLEGVAVLDKDSSSCDYGLTIENHTLTDLFLYVLFFDPRKYVIQVSVILISEVTFHESGLQSVYLPPSNLFPSLKHHGSDGSKLGIGYGPSGGRPLRFSLPTGINKDAAFIKVFVSTEYANMDAILTGSYWLDLDRTEPALQKLWSSWIYLISVVA